MKKILHIASLFPVSDSPNENAYVRSFISAYSSKTKTEFTVLKPVSYIPEFLIFLTGRKNYWKKKRTLIKSKSYFENGLNIKILPFFSIGSISVLHSIFSILAYYCNSINKRFSDVKKFDTIHAHYLFPDGYFAYRLSKKFDLPYVLTLQQEHRFFKNFISRKLSKQIISEASSTTTLSFQMHESLDSHFKPKQFDLLPLGIEECFFEEPIERQEESKRLRIISVCNLLPVKNIESVIKAINGMANKDMLTYSIYGSGPEEKALTKLVENYHLDNIVEFKGQVKNSDLPEIYRKYDVFIQPSFKESFGLTYFEALACGLPVMITENTGAYPLIKDHDVYFLIDPHNVGSISDSLSEILKDKSILQTMSVKCREVSKLAHWSSFVSYFEKAYLISINEE